MAGFYRTPIDIGSAGEKAVVADLQAKGFVVTRWDTRGPGSTDIEALSQRGRILVQVKTSVWPSQPADLSPMEGASLRRRAGQLGAQAIHAKVVLGPIALETQAIGYVTVN